MIYNHTNLKNDVKNKTDSVSNKNDLPPQQSRRIGTMRQLSNLVPTITKSAFRNYSPKATQIISDWPEIVGEHYGRHSTPQKLVNGILTIACNGPTATEFQYASQTVISKINVYCGQPIVKKLKFIYKKEAILEKSPCKKSSYINISIEPVPIKGIPSGPLGDALSRLGGFILARKKGKF